MNSAPEPKSAKATQMATSRGLLWWLILLSMAAIVFAGLAGIFGWLINMDTLIEMNPNGDPLVRQDALGMRVFFWTGVACYILLLTAGVVGAWIAYRRRRNRMSFGLSLLAAVPIALVIAVFTYFIVREIAR